MENVNQEFKKVFAPLSHEESFGFSVKELEDLGFKKARSHKLGDEYQAILTPELEKKIIESDMKKIWGIEGCYDSYAVFIADVEEHPDFGKTIVSLYPNLKKIDVNEEFNKILDNKKPDYKVKL